ncbi:glycosyltransferase [Kaistella antarctica]|uniref:N-glycosyltransferase n=1 Tax=Kaistella antarctica TaxID=266748 RepID=A0A448NRH4_9FLAO|nr:glycosyltransferase [Kaistella antarctica]KEY18777.1 hypothetical protein HY04_09900 [Kaistella antarctica]SEW15547.1 Glycosyl transferase family 2 [Kaistella antarctica]VEH99531.1 N-glycosyltransferase [Kaistella antarctica]
MTSSEKKYPLLSLIIFVYNQQDLITESLDGVYLQEYPNLEIIISDDCSTDNSFKVIENYVATHKLLANHKIILNRNEKNLGLVKHVEHVVKNISKGELIIVGAGDDIALKNRVKVIYEAWNHYERKPKLITTKFIKFENLNSIKDSIPIQDFDESLSSLDTNELSYFIRFLMGGAGCTFAYSREVFNEFPSLEINNIEDRNLAIRAKILGEILYLNIPTVLYRVGNGVTSSITNETEFRLFKCKNAHSIFSQVIKDTNYSKLVDKKSKRKIKKVCLSSMKFYRLAQQYYTLKGAKKLMMKLRILLTTYPKLSAGIFLVK